MRLDTYLDSKSIPDSDFAVLIGVSRQTVHRYKSGERFPEPPILSKISEVTNGEVTANDFVDLASEPNATAVA